MSSLRRSGVVLLLLSIGTCWLQANEKSGIARNAGLVVVGRLTAVWSFPWIDGWHFRGQLKVARVLWGSAKPGDSLDYRFVCDECGFWPRPRMDPFDNVRGLWFLNRSTGASWRPNSTQSGDTGFRYMRDLQYFEKVLSKRNAGGE